MIFVRQIDDSSWYSLLHILKNMYEMDIRSRKAIFSRVDPLWWALQPLSAWRNQFSARFFLPSFACMTVINTVHPYNGDIFQNEKSVFISRIG